MAGIVVVSHSPALARAAVELALEMVGGAPPRIEIAAGTADGGTGTDAMRVADAIAAADDGGGVAVIMDLGSAVLSAELALEFLPDPSIETRLVAAPFVEGILVAVVRAAGGATLDEVAREAEGALGAKTAQLGGAGQGAQTPVPAETPADAEGEATLVNEVGLHARPAARIVAAVSGLDARVTIAAGEREVPADSPTALAGLGARLGERLTVRARGSEADAAVEAVLALVRDGFGEGVGGVPGPKPAAAPPAAPAPARLGVSAGRVVGPVAVMTGSVREPDAGTRVPESGRERAASGIREAAERVAASLLARAAQVTGDARELLETTAAMAVDPMIVSDAAARVRDEGTSPERAVWLAVEAVAEIFRGIGGLQAERVTDLHDVRDRLIAELTGTPAAGIPRPGHPFVLVAVDLAPADTATLDPTDCLAIVTEQGGPTAHTAILARSLGIPAIVGAAGATGIAEGTVVLVDGTSGELIVDPDEAERASASGSPALQEPFAGAGATADGTQVPILANLGSARDVERAIERGAEGVGLFRTEFSFLDREEAPSVDEQIAAYRPVFAGFAGGYVVVRTLDAGSDKPLPFLTPAGEENPALGVRGFRTARLHPEVLDDQLVAIARAAGAEGTDARVMAPMIATVDEARDFAGRARAAGLSTVGVMIETPAAALLARELLDVVDFVSLGTNDLAQYTLAADRLSGPLSELNEPWQPALLRLVRLVGEAGAATGKPVGVCGEAAADPALAAVLVGLGARSLSMSAPAVPLVGRALGALSLARCERAAQAAADSGTAAEARSRALSVLHEHSERPALPVV